MWLRPLVRIDTVPTLLFSGDALPMQAFAAYSLSMKLNWTAISLLGGELALPSSGGPRQPL